MCVYDFAIIEVRNKLDEVFCISVRSIAFEKGMNL